MGKAVEERGGSDRWGRQYERGEVVTGGEGSMREEVVTEVLTGGEGSMRERR